MGTRIRVGWVPVFSLIIVRIALMLEGMYEHVTSKGAYASATHEEKANNFKEHCVFIAVQ